MGGDRQTIRRPFELGKDHFLAASKLPRCKRALYFGQSRSLSKYTCWIVFDLAEPFRFELNRMFFSQLIC